MTVKQEPSGENETVARANQSTARRLHWNGDLSRDYYIAFELVNIQRKDAGDYGMRLRVDHFPPIILQDWFSLIVQVRRIFFSDRQWKDSPPPATLVCGPIINFAIAFLSNIAIETGHRLGFPVLLRWSPVTSDHMGCPKWRLCPYRERDDVIYVALSVKYTNINPCKNLYSLFLNFRSYTKVLNNATYIND